MHWRSSIFRRASGRDCAVVAPVSPPAAKRPRPWGHGRYKAQGLEETFRSIGSDHFFFVGSFLRLVLARSRSCFSDIDSAIFLEGPFKLDFFCSPRLAASAAPAAFCCFFERAGILLYRFAPKGWLHMLAKGAERK